VSITDGSSLYRNSHLTMKFYSMRLPLDWRDCPVHTLTRYFVTLF